MNVSGTGDLRPWLINKVLIRFGYMLVPTPPSGKMMHEHANISESFHPSRGGLTVAWMRYIGDLMALNNRY